MLISIPKLNFRDESLQSALKSGLSLREAEILMANECLSAASSLFGEENEEKRQAFKEKYGLETNKEVAEFALSHLFGVLWLIKNQIRD